MDIIHRTRNMNAVNPDTVLAKVWFNDLINKDKTIDIIKHIFKIHNLEHLYKSSSEQNILKLIDTNIKHAESINNNPGNTGRKIT